MMFHVELWVARIVAQSKERRCLGKDKLATNSSLPDTSFFPTRMSFCIKCVRLLKIWVERETEGFVMRAWAESDQMKVV